MKKIVIHDPNAWKYFKWLMAAEELLEEITQQGDAFDRATQGPLSPEVAKEMIDGLDKAFGLK